MSSSPKATARNSSNLTLSTKHSMIALMNRSGILCAAR